MRQAVLTENIFACSQNASMYSTVFMLFRDKIKNTYLIPLCQYLQILAPFCFDGICCKSKSGKCIDRIFVGILLRIKFAYYHIDVVEESASIQRLFQKLQNNKECRSQKD